MIESILLAAVQSTTADTTSWAGSQLLVMNICMILGLIIAKIGIKNKGKGPSLPLLQPLLGPGFGWPELLAGLSIGHVLGVGTVLGLTNTGLLT
ncbi:MAG TPA: photosystem I reaction center subunit PsaK [Coleofasciculaceae cyanobacterium]